MIDLEIETPVPLEQLRHHRLLALKTRHGKPLTFKTLWSWIEHGLRDRSGATVKLDHIRQGGTLASTPEALARFFESLSAPGEMVKQRTQAQTKTAQARAESILRAAGVLKSGRKPESYRACTSRKPL